MANQPLGVAVVDQKLRVQLWNNWLEQWSGLSAEQVLQRTLNDLFPSLAGGELSEAIDNTLRNGRGICWTQTVDPERLDHIEQAMTRGDRELPLHRVQLSVLDSCFQGQQPQRLCLLQIDEAPYDPLFAKERKPSARSGESPAYIETDWLGVVPTVRRRPCLAIAASS